jgi:hypothetical protein
MTTNTMAFIVSPVRKEKTMIALLSALASGSIVLRSRWADKGTTHVVVKALGCDETAC